MKKLLTIAASAVALFGLASCGSSTEDGLYGAKISKVDVSDITFVQKGKLTVGMSTDFAPMEFIDTTKSGQDQFVGADVSLAKAIASAFDLELEIKAMNFDMVLTGLDQGLIDIAISGYSYTAERAASYLPSKCYYEEGDGGQVYIINKSDTDTYKTLEDLNKASVKVAVQNGSLQEALTTAQVPNCNMMKITNLDDAIVQLQAGTYNAVCCALSVAENKVILDDSLAIMEEALDAKGYEGNFAWFNKNNLALQTATNKVIDEVVTNNYFITWYDKAVELQLNLGDSAMEIIPE